MAPQRWIPRAVTRMHAKCFFVVVANSVRFWCILALLHSLATDKTTLVFWTAVCLGIDEAVEVGHITFMVCHSWVSSELGRFLSV